MSQTYNATTTIAPPYLCTSLSGKLDVVPAAIGQANDLVCCRDDGRCLPFSESVCAAVRGAACRLVSILLVDCFVLPCLEPRHVPICIAHCLDGGCVGLLSTLCFIFCVSPFEDDAIGVCMS